MSDERALSFDELWASCGSSPAALWRSRFGDDRTELLVRGEGEFGHLEGSGHGEWSFQLGGDPPPEREGIRFIVATWIVIHIDGARALEAHDIATGVGVPITLRVRMAGGLELLLWPAMPPEEQWTDRHEENR